MKLLIFIVALFCFSCNTQDQQLEKLTKENTLLRDKVNRLETQKEVFESQIISSSVTLANTTIRELTSKYNGQKYQIKISFPKSYHKNLNKKYPVLYVIDAETNFGGISYVVQRLIKDKLIPEILVVGIAYNTDYENFYRLRSRDLTPVEDKDLRIGGKPANPTGGAPKFSSFFEFELFPFIFENFRVNDQDRAIYGHSYGGLFGSYSVLEKPNLFNRYILLSPSLWFHDNLLVHEAQTKNMNFDKETYLYMASGELEGRIDDLQEEFVQILNKRNFKNLKVKSEVKKNETHRTIFGVGFTNGLRFIYKK